MTEFLLQAAFEVFVGTAVGFAIGHPVVGALAAAAVVLTRVVLVMVMPEEEL